ncbi:hypothetical protein HUU05_21255 [candidate division KSB1 bacterium]|nr:hypothetical protein [candidate division KSB1 bacterium]
MSSLSVQVAIPFDSLIEAVKNPSAFEQRKLWEVLETQLGQYEEDQFENDPVIRNQVAEARAAYRAGDFQTLDEYQAQRKERDK